MSEAAVRMAGSDDRVLTAQSAANVEGIIRRGQASAIRELTVYVVFSAGVTAGAVVIEAAHDPTYAGTWSNLGTVNWAAASRVHHVSITGVHLAIRIRISSAIVGGTIDAYAIGN